MVTTRELCHLATITYRQADYWIRCGYLICLNPEAGSGIQRLHDPAEVRVARALRQVQAAGCHVAREIAESVRALPEDTSGPVLFCEHGQVTDSLDEARWVIQIEPELALA